MRRKSSSRRKSDSRRKRRANLLESLEARQLLAGPQLIGIQPNEGELIVDGSVRQTAPRVLTFRFDENQIIDPNTFDGIEIVRAGPDGQFDPTGTPGSDDVFIQPALVSAGDDAPNEVVVRFADSLPDDAYQFRINSFDDPVNGITALRNSAGEVLVSRSDNPRTQTINMDLQLGAIIESVVPQPLIRNADGSLTQNRNEIVVYFNEDPLFAEDEYVAEVTSVDGDTLRIEAAFADGEFQSTDVQFTNAPVGTPVSAEYVAESDLLVISSRSTTTISEIINAIGLIPRFEASSTADGSTVFNPGIGVVASIEARATERSVENPRFYQLFLTQDTVRTTDDALYFPDEVIYDPTTHTARLFFATDLNELTDDADGNAGVGLAGGTFRLRVGTAVDNRVDVVLEPRRVDVTPQVSTDFGISGLNVQFIARSNGEPASPLTVEFIDGGSGGLVASLETGGRIVFDLGGSQNSQVRDLRIAAASSGDVNSLIDLSWSRDGVAGAGGTTFLPQRIVGANPLALTAVGDTFETSLDVGTFGSGEITSLIFTETIAGKPSDIVLPGVDLLGTPQNGFAIDTVDGVPTVAYNFNGVFQFDPTTGTSHLNQITEVQKERVREALGLYAAELGIQFRETVDEGITFARGDRSQLLAAPGGNPVGFNDLDATLRIDSTFDDSAIVFSNQADFETSYGADFTRKAAAGIGLLLGLNVTPGLPPQTLLALNENFIEDTINPGNEAALRNLEPVFPSNFDVLQGQALYRPDSNDVDLYRFQVDLNDADQVGTFTAQTFAERLPDSSLLDTTLTLFREETATAETDFGLGRPLDVRFESKFEGKIGNDTELRFTPGGTTTVQITPGIDAEGNEIDNVVVVEIPRAGTASIDDIVAAINNSPISSSLLTATVVGGDGTQLAGSDFDFNSISLSNGGLVALVRNDDYFSEDSRIIATLGAGTYYVGVASTGNDNYDPTIADSGFGGRTGGQYELHLKYEPQVDEVDAIRDLDGSRPGVPSTPIDGDGDGVPGGVHNFWFQTRSLNRRIEFTSSSAALQPGQTITITDVLGDSRTYEFVPNDQAARPGNVAITYPSTGLSLPPAAVAQRLVNAFNLEQTRTTDSGTVGLSQNGAVLEFIGVRSVELSDDFRGAETYGRMIFVDKTAGVDADGSLSQPFNNISNPDTPNAFGASVSGDIVRIVGNGGNDGDESTESDNQSYQIGVANTGGGSLQDGRHMEIPQGVTTVIDAGAIFKLRNSRIGVGSSTLTQDRSGGALQVLGTPRRVVLSRQGEPVVTTALTDNETVNGYRDGAVIFTSLNDSSVGTSAGSVGNAAPGDWGGIVFRRDVDQSEGRGDLEDEGIFLQHVSNADLRYGGGANVIVDAVQQLINPIQIFNLRPTITQSEIRFSADAAISASPDSFEETTFQAPRFQSGGEFTADYTRVGPSIYDNFIVDNSINGLFVRVVTTPGEAPRELTLSGRFDDTDIVHYFAENLKVAGTPGGSIADELRPDFASTAFNVVDGGALTAGDYSYRLTFVDASGFESLASDASITQTVGDDSSIELLNLPPVPQSSDYIGRRLYRLVPGTNEFRFVAGLNATQSRFFDNGSTTAGVLDLNRQGIRGRLDASLVIDPATVIKLAGVRLELGQGTHLYAEGVGRDRVVFTSFADDRFGAGGTFDTNNDAALAGGNAEPQRADWSGIYASPTAYVSLDHATVAYGGGISLLEGGVARGFAPLELQQADARVTNTRFEFNDDGQDGAGPVGRFGRLGITPSTIFVRGSQPIIVGNEFIDNRGSIIDIDVDSMTAERLVDTGRQTEFVGAFNQLEDNYGPLIRLNRYDSVATGDTAERQLSGLEIRGGLITTETIFDDTDIDHLLFDTLEVGNLNVSGGLRLLSRSGQSLVVKLTGSGSPYSDTFGTGLTATGALGNDPDRVGGSVQIVGIPGAPVVLTSLRDDTIGSGLRPDGSQLTDTGGDGAGSRPEANDWRGILFDRYSNDRNVDYILERTISNEAAPGLNGTAVNAQELGELATNEFGGDEVRRLGFEVEGFLSSDNDIDNYSFQAVAGTRVWLDIDTTSYGLDTVIELIDEQGNVLARSNDSFSEVAGTPLESLDDSVAETAGSLASGPAFFIDTGAGGLYDDIGSVNPRDAGFSVTLPGNRGSESVYKLRVRSRGINPDDLDGGLTNGGYRFQLRIREAQENPGSLVRFADIRYANHGIHVIGKPGESPLLGDAQENEVFAGFEASNDSLETNETAPGRRAQYLGNLQESRNGSFSVGGAFGTNDNGVLNDFVDFYRLDVDGDAVNSPTIFDIDYADGFSRPNTTLAIFYDRDGDDGDGLPELVLYGEDSNILDDQALVGATDQLELLRRGSIATGDAYIGPVALPQGVYYIGVLPDGRFPTALNQPTTRREPIDSVQRIFDDHIESSGGTTFAPPVEPSFVDTGSTDTGWIITNDRSGDSGHVTTSTFTGSRVGDVLPNSSFVAPNQNDQQLFADAIRIEDIQPEFSLTANQDIGDQNQNTSTFIPHTTIIGSTARESVNNFVTTGDIVDIFSFEVPAVANGNATVILDIDNGFNPFTTPEDADLPDGQPAVVDPSSIDLKLQLIDATGTVIDENSSEFAFFGALGSESTNGLDSEDPFIQTTLPPGIYFVAVSPEATTYNGAGGDTPFTFDLDEDSRPASGTYQLHVSVQDHPTVLNGGINQSYQFDRANNQLSGTLRSVPFDLSGYSAGDQPRIYFNQFYSPAPGDIVTVTARSAQQTTPQPIAGVNLTPSSLFSVWEQQIGSLDAFAGHSDVVIEFNYQTNGTVSAAEGLFIDDIIVGFAERGELVTGAIAGESTFAGGTNSPAGEYQLEIRPGSQYQPTPGSVDTTFNTNDRLTRSATIVAPDPSQLVDGDTFTLSDEVRTLSFEFDVTGDGATPGNIRVLVDTATTADQVAEAIRAAINLPLVGSTLDVKASDTSGDTAGGNRGDEVAITGTIVGDFIELTRTDDLGTDRSDVVDGDGNFQLPVRFFDGVGDGNVVRAQSQIIIDSNKISDVRGIGIWSEYGERLTSPQDARGDDPTVGLSFDGTFTGIYEFDFDDDNDFLELTPMGNVTPGAVRNLPTLNNNVVGGLAPGPVIVNNTIDNAGYAGIKVDGSTRPIVIDSPFTDADFAVDPDDGFGDLITDGLVMIIDAADTRVVFEFEDIGGAPVMDGGSGVLGGDGFADGHVPIYYSHQRAAYNPGPPFTVRTAAHTRHEVMMAIYQSIQGSILVTNGLVDLVHTTLGPSPFIAEPFTEATYLSEINFPTPAVFVEGASGVYWDTSFQKVGPFGLDNNPQDADSDTSAGVFFAQRAPIHESPQPTARIVNNTIYGDDGQASDSFETATNEPNDTVDDAIVINAGSAHSGPYQTTGTIGDELTALEAASDVDVYRVNLTVGDRLVVDVDTDPTIGLDTTLRLFDSSGNEILLVTDAVLADHLDPSADVDVDGNPIVGQDVTGIDADNDGVISAAEQIQVDPSIDFQAQATDTYYVAISSNANDAYDPFTVDGRVAGSGGVGQYDLSIEVFAPRSYVFSLDDENNAGNSRGTQGGGNLVGTTFTVSTVADNAGGTNQTVFEFTSGNQPVTPGAEAIDLVGDLRVPDVMRAIADAIDAADLTLLDRDVVASALGGEDGVLDFPGGSRGLTVYRGPVLPPGNEDYVNTNGVAPTPLDYVAPVINAEEFPRGFGHDRTAQVGSGAGNGTTELYVFVERVARIELSPEAIAAGLALDPQPGQDSDQLLPEVGLMLTGGSSATVINNVFANLHQSIVVEQTRLDGFSGNDPLRTLKPADVIVTANVFQDDNPVNPLFRQRMNTAFGNTGLTTDFPTGPSNVNDANDDRNEIVPGGVDLLQNPGGNNFLPAETSTLIDGSTSSVTERDALRDLRTSIGLSISNILAPDRDGNGVLRQDNPDFAPDTVGGGGKLFLDQGANELADSTGPTANLIDPLDNDPEGIDVDPETGFLRLNEGVYQEFRIQLRDTGDASDPFNGLGVDDSTVVVAPIGDLRSPGANLTLFENERLLTEGVDYSFDYDETQNVITLRPLAGIFQDDRAYRIALNNQDSTVLVAPSANAVSDGESLTVTDDTGAQYVYEFETGITVNFPDPVTLLIPDVGVGVGGINDNDLFTLSDAQSNSVTFEFDAGTGTLSGTVPINLPAGPVPSGGQALAQYRLDIAIAIENAINSRLVANDPGNTGDTFLDLDVRRIDDQIVIGGEVGAFADTESGGLQQLNSTLALRVPVVGVANRDGDLFVINDGTQSITFELDNDNNLNSASNFGVFVAGQTASDSAQAILTAILQSPLALQPTLVDGQTIYLNLPSGGSVDVVTGPLEIRGITRLADDGSLVVVTPPSGGDPVIFELNRTDLTDANGIPVDDGVQQNHRQVNFTRENTAEEIAESFILAITNGDPIPGISNNDLEVFNGNLLSVGGAVGLTVESDSPSLRVIGEPGVTESSNLAVAGPVLLAVPFLGGSQVEDGDVLILDDQNGDEAVFEFVLNGRGITIPGAFPVTYTTSTTSQDLANALIDAINNAAIGIQAQANTTNQISLGVIPISQVNVTGLSRDGDLPLAPGATLPEQRALSSFTLEQGLVTDGEVLTIRQGDTVVSYEFESATGGGGVRAGNVPISFDPDFVPDPNQTPVVTALEALNRQIALTIANNLRGLNLAPEYNEQTGRVTLNDQPGTIIDVSQSPSLRVAGVPGGAIPVSITPAFSAVDTKQALIAAINGVASSNPDGPPIQASDRGGNTFFITGGTLFEGPLTKYNLPAISDLAGQPLKPNVGEATQFTLLLPTIGLDYGDAPDPRNDVAGRYPTRLVNNGARHIVDRPGEPGALLLGTAIDVDVDGLPSTGADGDDLSITAVSSSELFDVSVVDGVVRINIRPNVVDPLLADGETITISSGPQTATLEFDIDGRFDEDNFAISPSNPTAVTSIRLALADAIEQSPLAVASVTTDPTDASVLLVSADDEDGVNFSSAINPDGYVNAGVPLMIDVTVTGSGVLEAWIDFDADGVFGESEQIIPQPGGANIHALREEICPAGEAGMESAVFAGDGSTTRSFCVVVPPSASLPETLTETYARFRVSREGGLGPTGLALSGEVEDYALTIQPGSPPEIPTDVANRTFTVSEDSPLQVLDRSGLLTPNTTSDDGLLVGVIEPDNQNVAVFVGDIGSRPLATESGAPAGQLEVFEDGTFTFSPVPDFFGTTSFSVRVTDVNPLAPENALVSPTLVNVDIVVEPVNDRPEAISVAPVQTSVVIAEDTVTTFLASDLIDPFYSPGPSNESDQVLVFQSVSGAGVNQSTLEGSLAISQDGRSITYTPPADSNEVLDSFFYVVADVPADGQTSAQATRQGTVFVDITPVNDPPRTDGDTFNTDEGTSIEIDVSNGTDGILDNDFGGPANELDPDSNGHRQAVRLVETGYPLTTFRGGTVTLLPGDQDSPEGRLLYEPPAFFNGVDTFSYRVIDVLVDANGDIVQGTNDLGQESTGTVDIIVGGVNNGPEFLRVDVDGNPLPISRPEAKTSGQTQTFDLNTLFRDREGDPITYSVSSSDPSAVSVELSGSLMTLTFEPFRSGDFSLTVSATDVLDDPDDQLTTTVQIPVLISDTPDAPELIGRIGTLNGREEEIVTFDLSTVFFDRDGVLGDDAYSVTRFGLVGGTPGDIQTAIDANPLVRSIEVVNGELRITLEPDQFGDVDIDLTASDGNSQVTDSFTLSIASVPDAPRLGTLRNEAYNVPIGSELQVIDPALGLLQNVIDPDGDTISMAPESVGEFSLQFGTLTVLDDGTFTYFNDPSKNPTVGDIDTFSYTVEDSTGLQATFESSFEINQSRYQNPIGSLQADVNADGSVSPIDSLRVINFLRRSGSRSIDVGTIGAPPPDYLDVNGDGQVTPTDALNVINELRRRRSATSGESPSASPAALSLTTTFAIADSAGLGSRNIEPVVETESNTVATTPQLVTDQLLTVGVEIETSVESASLISAVEPSDSSPSDAVSAADEAIAGLWDDENIHPLEF